VTELCHPNREEENREEEEQRERRPRSLAPVDSENLELKAGEILPLGRGRGKPKPMVAGWRPSDVDLVYAADKGLPPDVIEHEIEKYRESKHDMTFRLWIIRAVEFRQRQPNTRGESIGLTGFMRGVEGALAAREARTRKPP
jgi:hypothetical protein